MFYLACTRFNNLTYAENTNYRNKQNEIAIYGTTLKIRDIYNVGTLIFIVEMNNDQNKIEGIGLIKNLLVCDKRHKIYDNEEVRNMFTAMGVHIGTNEEGEKELNLSNLRYHKIVIMTDADVDGSHIRTLILTLFFRHMKKLIENPSWVEDLGEQLYETVSSKYHLRVLSENRRNFYNSI